MMKTLFAYISLFFFFLITSCQDRQGETVKEDTVQTEVKQDQAQPKQERTELAPAWETDTLFRTPESAYFHQGSSSIYVSNINGEPLKKDGNGFISKLNSDGKIDQLKWVTGLDAPKGIGISGNTLYVTDIDKIVEVDVSNGKILRKHFIQGAQFLNDIVLAADSVVYFSDTQTNKIHSLKNNNFNVWLDKELNGPNGLEIRHDSLFVAMMNNGEFKSFSLKSKEGRVVSEGFGAGDGVVALDSPDAFLISNWNGEVWLLKGKEEKTKLLDTKEKNIQAADIGYIKDKNLLLVPTFNNNRISAYNLKRE